MADVLNIGRSVRNLHTSPKFAPVSAVRMIVDDDTFYDAGTDTGYEFEIESPWATQAQATWLLSKMSGLEYAPFEADRGQLHPEAEIGDYVNIRGVFGGLLSEDINFGKGYTATFGSPADEEIDHEYKYESKTDRQLSQKVSRKSPAGNAEFGWSLQDDQWKIFNESGDIFRVSATGAWLKGHLDIVEGSINLNNKFIVDADGNMSAVNATLSGTLTIGGTEITAANLRKGAQSSVDNGPRWTTGSGYGYNYNSAAQYSNAGPSFFHVSSMYGIGNAWCNLYSLSGHLVLGVED